MDKRLNKNPSDGNADLDFQLTELPLFVFFYVQTIVW